MRTRDQRRQELRKQKQNDRNTTASLIRKYGGFYNVSQKTVCRARFSKPSVHMQPTAKENLLYMKG